jgi:hypothetical protein
MRTILLAAATAALAGCATAPPAFRPTNPTAETQGGEPAEAVLIRGRGRPVAHVLVRTVAASVANDGARGAGVRVVVEILNVGPHAIAFDPYAVELQAFDRRGAALPAARFEAIAPDELEALAIVPAASRVVELVFTLPSPPEKVHDVVLRWALVAADGERHARDTRFTRDVERRRTAVAHDPSFMVN